MRLPKPETIRGDLPGQVQQVGAYLVRLHRALETELDSLRKAVKDRGLTLNEIIDGVLASEKVLDTIYKYCEKRRKKEEADDGTTS